MSVKVSIVIISYNQGQFIEETIKSVLSQTYQNVELLLVDGGSTDETVDIIMRYKDRFSVFIHEKDEGQTDAINKGFKLATGDLVGWINSDDILYPNCVEKIVSLYEQNADGVIFYSKIDIVDIEGKKIGEFSVNIKNKDYLLKKNFDVCQPGSFYSLKTVQKSDFLNDKLRYCMDLDLWLRLLNHGSIHRVEGETLAAIRVGDYTKTSTGGKYFLREIRATLLHHGASRFASNIIRSYWIQLKVYIRRILNYK